MEILFDNGMKLQFPEALSLEMKGRMVTLLDSEGELVWAGNSLRIVSITPLQD